MSSEHTANFQKQVIQNYSTKIQTTEVNSCPVVSMIRITKNGCLCYLTYHNHYENFP